MNIDIKVEKGRILNIEELIKTIEDCQMTFDEVEYFESLLNKLQYAEYENKEELMGVIREKLLAYTIENKDDMENKKALETLQQYNEDLKKLSIIETTKEKNDTKKDIDYIAIRHDDGSIDMLVCAGKSSLSHYIEHHIHDLSHLNAEQIFHYFKETVHQDLSFYKTNEIQEKNPNMVKRACVREEDVIAFEEQKVEEYARKYGVSDQLFVTVDPSGERLYVVGDAVLKFYTNAFGERTMQTLIKPTKMVPFNEYDNLLQELESDVPKIEEPSPNIEQTTEETEIEFDAEKMKKKEFDEEELAKGDYSFDLQVLKDLIMKKREYGMELSENELGFLSYGIRHLVDTMEERVDVELEEKEEDVVLDDYMKPIVELYEKIEKGYQNKQELSDFEYSLAKDYLANKERMKTLQKMKKPKMLEYTYQPKEDTRKAGSTTLLFVLEIALIAILVFLLLLLEL